MRKRIWLAMCFALLAMGSARAAGDVIVVFDASNSMWGQINGIAKIEIAREVMGNILADWDPGTNLGLVVYGHRSTDDCSDIETVIRPGPLDAAAYMAEINSITPRGRTPLTDAVQHAAEDLAYRDNPGTVILISDGIESCNRDPCAVAELLAQDGIAFTAHVVGFGLAADQDPETLSCIADATGGMFLTAQNAGELTDALAEIATQVAQAPPAPEPRPPPPEPEPAPAVEITAPAHATVGSMFRVSWTPDLGDLDFVTIVPVGTDQGELGNSVRTSAEQPAGLQAPAEPGFYEIRYVRNDGRETLGMVTIEIVDAEIVVTAPQTAIAGATFGVSWSQTIDGRDFITIVPLGADEGTLGNSIRASADQPGGLQAPAEPGFYEIRYMLNEGRRTLAIAQIEIVAAEVTLTAPETAVAGAVFPVEWSAVIDGRDFITIVPLGADEGTLGNSIRASADQPGGLQAPAEPGFYEIRYMLNEGRRTLATAQIEIAAAEVAIEVSATIIRATDEFRVTWSSTIDGRDFITIVPLGADEGTLGTSIRASAGSPGDLEAPVQPGLYEVRYVLNEGRRTIATTTIEVVAADAALNQGATLDVPETVAPGATFAVNWTAEVTGGDQRITLAAPDQADFTWIAMKAAADGPPLEFQAPAEPGFYEIRFLDIGRQEVLSRVIFEVR